MSGGEDFCPIALEGVLDPGCWDLVGDADGDNAADRRSGDQVEAGRQGCTDAILDVGENTDRIKTEVSAAAEAENLERHRRGVDARLSSYCAP
jgi:hypothetical protein